MPSLCPECGATLLAGSSCARCGHVGGATRASSPEPAVCEATILFCDLGGYTAWNEEEEPELVVQVMDRIKLQAIRVFQEHGGIANQFIGDEILGLFGVTSSHEDDPCRAVSAAMELHAYVREQRVFRANGERRVLELHTGIATGPVLARVTDSRAGLFDVTGDVVNTAARLRALAGPGQILVAPSTHEAIGALFDTEAQPPATVRGKALPVVPHRVLARRRLSGPLDAALGRSGGLSALVGREADLSLLCAAWERACAGRGGLVSVEGPAGIGKSRLFYELRQRVVDSARDPDALILHGRCSGYNAGPYQPFIEALRARLSASHVAAESLPAQLRRLAPLSDRSVHVLSYLVAPGPDCAEVAQLEGELLRQAIVDALEELITLCARQQPVLVALEDFHDADESSLSTLRHLAERVVDRRVLIAVNHRPSEHDELLRSVSSAHLSLAQLDREGTRALARATLAAQALSPELASYVYDQTLGNPFFVEEICRGLVERGAVAHHFGFVVPTQELAPSQAPRSVQSVVRSRFERLPTLHKKALRLASVLGVEFALECLELIWAHPRPVQSALVSASAWQAMGPSTAGARLTDLLQDLERQLMIEAVEGRPSPTFRFRHAIAREVVYQSLPRQERRWYHGEIAAWIERHLAEEARQTHYEMLAHHYARSENVAKAVDYALLSAAKAWRSFSLDQARAQYERAIALLGPVEKLDPPRKRAYIEASLGWGRSGVYNPRADQRDALITAHAFAVELGDAHAACACLNWLSWIDYAIGHHATALASSQAFLQSAEALEDPGSIAQALANLGYSFAMATDYDRAATLIEAGIARRGRATGTAHAYSLGCLAMIRGDQGDVARSSQYLEQGARIIEPTGRDTLLGPALIQRGMIESWRGDFEACQQTARRAHAVALRIGGHYIRGMSLYLEGYALGMLHEPSARRGVAQLHEGISTLEALGMQLHLSSCWAALSELRLRSRDHDDAAEAAENALKRAADGDRLGEVQALRVLAMVVLRRDGHLERAQELLARAQQEATRKQSPREVALNEVCLAELSARTGDRSSAERLARSALSALALHDLRGLRAQAREHLGDLAP